MNIPAGKTLLWPESSEVISRPPAGDFYGLLLTSEDKFCLGDNMQASCGIGKKA